MSSPERLHVIHITVAPELGEALDAALTALNVAASRWQATDDHNLRFDLFLATASRADELESTLCGLLAAVAEEHTWTVTTETIRNEDWQESWKQYFHVERVSKRIVTKPSWEPYTPESEDCVIEIDPGMSFGTGQHATTKGCLRFLDALATREAPKSFLDLGCGSGILSIAAARLGYTPILAFDYDPEAVRTAGANFAQNGVSERVSVAIGDVSTLEVAQPYALVAANILAPVLLANAEHIAATVLRPGGHLLLAGILTEQYDKVCKTYTALGFREQERATEAEWTSGCFSAAPAAPTASH
ncbi:MAG: 50S ribosomal protein L11 methyltransferase [Verrucomicrobia bacterium]|jgi:ribosomal protein L11 methyltransferase|nr:50S ribosomal protein L11 methyltransferase [Verrucomicrobiota bacterium]